MSRSRKRTPIIGSSGTSEKSDKQVWHRRYRTKVRGLLKSLRYDVDDIDDTVMPVEGDVSNPWAMKKDGKHYVGKWIRGNAERIRRIMRK